MAEERLQKVLAQAGLGPRHVRGVDRGRPRDGRRPRRHRVGRRVDPALADIRVDGQPIAAEQHRYIILNKPAGYLSGPDPRAEYPSWEALVKVPERLYAVGRLDQDSEGLLLLTNDGDLAVRLTHPRYEHPKTYLVQVQGSPNPRKIRRLQHGVMLDDGRTLPARVVLWRELPADVGLGVLASVRKRSAAQSAAGARSRDASVRTVPTSWLKVTLREGRKRQLRRMVALLGHPAQRVIRIGLGPLALGDLRPGKWRDLMPGELKSLREAAGHGPVPGADASA